MSKCMYSICRHRSSVISLYYPPTHAHTHACTHTHTHTHIPTHKRCTPTYLYNIEYKNKWAQLYQIPEKKCHWPTWKNSWHVPNHCYASLCTALLVKSAHNTSLHMAMLFWWKLLQLLLLLHTLCLWNCFSVCWSSVCHFNSKTLIYPCCCCVVWGLGITVSITTLKKYKLT